MDSAAPQTSVKHLLFVCMGNICRSPAAASIFMALAEKKGVQSQFYVDSCGTTAWYIGHPADARMQAAAAKRGVKVVHTAQLFMPFFFDFFDQILASDCEVLQMLQTLAISPRHKEKIRLLTEFSRKFPKQDIPDPFYGGTSGFDKVLDMTEDACKGLLNSLLKPA